MYYGFLITMPKAAGGASPITQTMDGLCDKGGTT